MVLSFFPELAASEDEKIRKEIRDFICWATDRGSITKEQLEKSNLWLAWLEKQSEPKEINPSEFDSQLNRLLGQFKSLPKEELASSLSFYLNVVQNDGTYKEEKQGEQKPAEWSEEDFNTIDRIVCILDGIRYYNTVDNKQEKPYQSEIDWLKTRFKFLRPQSTWKPSGEQIKLLEDICGYNTIVTKEEMGVLESLLEELKKLTE